MHLLTWHHAALLHDKPLHGERGLGRRVTCLATDRAAQALQGQLDYQGMGSWVQGHLLARDHAALLDEQALQGELGARTREQPPLHAVRCGQPQHQHRPALPYPVAPVHCLRPSALRGLLSSSPT